MPRYIGYTPQFNPISLQEYLTVPTMLQQEFDTYEEKYNENLDKLATLEGMLDDSIKDYLNAYKGQLQNAADIISGKTGDLGTLRQQTSAARQFYREYAPRLTAAYTRRQEDLKAQRELELKDPSAITTQIRDMRSYLDNPDVSFHALSGDKVYTDMVDAGKMSAKDISSISQAGITGYIAQRTGYTPEEQQEYTMLVRQALGGNNAADKALRNNPKYSQPYQVLSKYIEDNRFGEFNTPQQAYALNRALSGQLMGMSGDVKYIEDLAWKEARADARAALSNSKKGGKRGSGSNTDNPYLIQSLASPDLGEKGQLKESTTNKITSKKTFSNNGYDVYPTGQVRPVLPNYTGIQNSPLLFTNQQATSNEPYREMGIYEASARFYGKQNDVQTQSKQTDAQNRHTIAQLAKKVDLRGNPIGPINDISERNLKAIYGLAQAAGFNKYNSFNSIPQEVKDKFYRYITTTGGNTGLVGYKIEDPNEEIAKIAYANLLNTTTDRPNAPQGLLTRKEFDELKSKGIRFYNNDGTPRTEQEIEWDAWDLLPRQYERYEVTHTRGAGAKYSQSATADYFAEFPSGKKYKDSNGKTITLTANENGTGFEGYSRPRYYLSAPLLRKDTGFKQLEIEDPKKGKKHTIEIPLSSFERGVVNSELKRLRGGLLNEMVKSGHITHEKAIEEAGKPVGDFLKAIEMGYIPGIRINDILDLLDDAILTASEENFIPSNSETEGSSYD